MSLRWAVVTGAGSGIGRATAVSLAEGGWRLVLAGRREGPLRESADLCRDAGAPEVSVRPCDVRLQRDCENLSQAVPDGARLALVNAAGVASFGPVSQMAPDRIESQIDTNLLGTIWATRAILPKMLEFGQGDIVNVLSIAASTPLPGAEVYSASKAGVLAFGRSLALTVRKQGVRVVAILPGATDTPLWDPSSGMPPREDMLPAGAVAEVIRSAIDSPRDRSLDEIVVMPPKGIL